MAVGWSIDRHQDTDMVNDAVNMAAKERLRGKAVILHSDHGTQFEGSPKVDPPDVLVFLGFTVFRLAIPPHPLAKFD